MPLQRLKCDCGEHDVEITCNQCEVNFCLECDEKTHWNLRLKQHERIPYNYDEMNQLSQRCIVQGHEKQTLPLFCQTCIKLVCALCVAGEHKIHSFVPLEEGTETAKRLLKESLIPIQERMTQAEEEVIVTQYKNKALQEEIKKMKKKLKKQNKK